MFTQENYNSLLQKLNELSEEKFKKFNDSLIPNAQINSIGVRVPLLRNIAKELLKGDYLSFIDFCKDNKIHEIVMLSAMVTALAKCDFGEKLKMAADFIPRIDNWAVCDIFCGDFKDAKKHLPETFEFLKKYINSKKEYEIRFAAVMLLDYFLNDEYIDEVLKIYDNIKHDGYYVKMAVAWGISIAFIKQREKTLDFLKNNNLDDFTFNKSIQKIRESFRVSQEDKAILNKMKRK